MLTSSKKKLKRALSKCRFAQCAFLVLWEMLQSEKAPVLHSKNSPRAAFASEYFRALNLLVKYPLHQTSYPKSALCWDQALGSSAVA